MSVTIDVVFDEGVLRPVEPLILPQGARMRVQIEDSALNAGPNGRAKVPSPRLAHPEQAADFIMQVREVPDARV